MQGRISFSSCIVVQCRCTVQPCHSLPGSNRLFHLLLEVPHSFFLKKRKKADNFVKYTDIEIYHTATFFCTFVTIFCPHIFVVLSLPKIEKLEHCMLSCFVSLVPYLSNCWSVEVPWSSPFLFHRELAKHNAHQFSLIG